MGAKFASKEGIEPRPPVKLTQLSGPSDKLFYNRSENLVPVALNSEFMPLYVVTVES